MIIKPFLKIFIIGPKRPMISIAKRSNLKPHYIIKIQLISKAQNKIQPIFMPHKKIDQNHPY